MSVFFYKARNKWACNFREDGKQKRRLFATEQEASSFLAELNQTAPESSRFTLAEIVIQFFKYHEDYHPITKKTIIYFLAGHDKDGKHIEGAGEFLRDKFADSLNRQDLERLRTNVKKSGRATNATCNKYQAYIRAMLAWAVDQELIVLNPWRDLKKLPTKQRICNANLGHFKAIIEQSPEWLQWAFYTAYACSLRFGIVELFNLRWDAFNWRQGYVQLHQGKSGKLKRVFPPKEYMHAAWHRYQEDMANGIIFVCHRAGKRVLSYKEAWKKAVKLAGLEHMGLRPYDIRHVAATEMLANGADLAAVSAQLGHSSVVTTGTFYAHVTAGSQQRASQKLPSLSTQHSGEHSSEQLVNKKAHKKVNEKG